MKCNTEEIEKKLYEELPPSWIIYTERQSPKYWLGQPFGALSNCPYFKMAHKADFVLEYPQAKLEGQTLMMLPKGYKLYMVEVRANLCSNYLRIYVV